eukprot:scaffold28550_cov76-Amphora_coffeaeformis.AAC.1
MESIKTERKSCAVSLVDVTVGKVPTRESQLISFYKVRVRVKPLRANALGFKCTITSVIALPTRFLGRRHVCPWRKRP